MSNYRRFYMTGGTWFFTVNFAEHKQNHLLVERVDVLHMIIQPVESLIKDEGFNLLYKSKKALIPVVSRLCVLA